MLKNTKDLGIAIVTISDNVYGIVDNPELFSKLDFTLTDCYYAEKYPSGSFSFFEINILAASGRGIDGNYFQSPQAAGN